MHILTENNGAAERSDEDSVVGAEALGASGDDSDVLFNDFLSSVETRGPVDSLDENVVETTFQLVKAKMRDEAWVLLEGFCIKMRWGPTGDEFWAALGMVLEALGPQIAAIATERVQHYAKTGREEPLRREDLTPYILAVLKSQILPLTQQRRLSVAGRVANALGSLTKPVKSPVMATA